MGSALASALFKKGLATTVWNRTTAKTEPLAKLGLHVAQSVLGAVKEADVLVISISNYDSTKQLLRHPEIEPALRGKVLVQLTTGTPDEAREMESWAQPHGIEYLDGAIIGNPNDIETPKVIALYSGSEELFNRVQPILQGFCDNAMFVGTAIGHASALDMAVLAFGVGAMLARVLWLVHRGRVFFSGVHRPQKLSCVAGVRSRVAPWATKRCFAAD
jgi:3-hydroxyisobutyrate dehydrogenase-like beta-hydroxyacid dehydrogenase